MSQGLKTRDLGLASKFLALLREFSFVGKKFIGELVEVSNIPRLFEPKATDRNSGNLSHSLGIVILPSHMI